LTLPSSAAAPQSRNYIPKNIFKNENPRAGTFGGCFPPRRIRTRPDWNPDKTPLETGLTLSSPRSKPGSAEFAAWELRLRAEALEAEIARARAAVPEHGNKARHQTWARAQMAARNAARALAVLVPLPKEKAPLRRAPRGAVGRVLRSNREAPYLGRSRHVPRGPRCRSRWR
jgi:hypothetical protein